MYLASFWPKASSLLSQVREVGFFIHISQIEVLGLGLDMRKGNLLFPSELLAGKLLPHLKMLHYFKETECIGLI